MTLLFDASALLNFIRLYKRSSYKTLKNNLVLSLTKYEIGNVLWKEALLLEKIDVNEALETISLLEKVLKIMITTEPSNSNQTFKLAHTLKITYYDASYIIASSENNAKLVTDDIKLARKVQEKMETVTKLVEKKLEIVSSDKIPYL